MDSLCADVLCKNGDSHEETMSQKYKTGSKSCGIFGCIIVMHIPIA